MAHRTLTSRQWLQKQFQSTGIQIEGAALKALASIIEEAEEPEQIVHQLLDKVETGRPVSMDRARNSCPSRKRKQLLSFSSSSPHKRRQHGSCQFLDTNINT